MTSTRTHVTPLVNVYQPKPTAGRDSEALAALNRRNVVAQEVVLPQNIASDFRRRVPATVARSDGKGRSSEGGAVNAQVNRQGVEVRVAVIDGADRMVYNDARDPKGWRQPLALGSAESEAKHRNKADHLVSTSEPRAVIAAVAATAHGPASTSGAALSGLTPYSAGKASFASRGFAGPARAADVAREARAQPLVRSIGR